MQSRFDLTIYYKKMNAYQSPLDIDIFLNSLPLMLAFTNLKIPYCDNPIKPIFLFMGQFRHDSTSQLLRLRLKFHYIWSELRYHHSFVKYLRTLIWHPLHEFHEDPILPQSDSILCKIEALLAVRTQIFILHQLTSIYSFGANGFQLYLLMNLNDCP